MRGKLLSHMNRSGNPESLPLEDAEVDQPEQRTVPWKIIILGVIALVLAVVIATQVLGVLYVIIFPPAPPLPGDLTLVSHTNVDYGVDEWLYLSSQNSCDVLIFYTANGGECRIAPMQCVETRTDDPNMTGESTFGQHIARCIGETKASIFAMRWQAIIATGPDAETPTQFRLIREVFWSGQIPPLPNLQVPEP
jgi:hypothetical protein